MRVRIGRVRRGEGVVRVRRMTSGVVRVRRGEEWGDEGEDW